MNVCWIWRWQTLNVNPDILHSKQINCIAEELVDKIDLDWSTLHAQSPLAIVALRDKIIDQFAFMPTEDVARVLPLFVTYMLEECNNQIENIDWEAIAIAIDNKGGMYHPLPLTKVILKHL